MATPSYSSSWALFCLLSVILLLVAFIPTHLFSSRRRSFRHRQGLFHQRPAHPLRLYTRHAILSLFPYFLIRSPKVTGTTFISRSVFSSTLPVIPDPSQNIRNNKTHARTPKWAQRYGLVDTSEIQRKERKSQWAVRYNDRTATSALEGMPYEEGQIPDRAHETASLPDGQDKGNGELWNREDESYYAESTSGNSGRWRYPANFDDPGLPSVSKKGKKKDRWARTEDAYHQSEERSRRKKSKKKQRASAAQPSINSRDSVEPPEDADGGHYRTAEHADTNKHAIPTTTNELLNHEL
ncbi:hypothetical protein APHAL10511_001172 [Amanita phalloides]|nr:hypothetical protein APHAL10511_001172 [Amanita phalloides]